jgi:hypothetical protein
MFWRFSSSLVINDAMEGVAIGETLQARRSYNLPRLQKLCAVADKHRSRSVYP